MTNIIKYTSIIGVLLVSVLGIAHYTKQPLSPAAEMPPVVEDSGIAKNTLLADDSIATTKNVTIKDDVILSETTQNTQKIVTIKPSTLFDFSDDRVLMGASQNVFVGKVIKQVGTKSFGATFPETQFLVEVVSNLKGNLNGEVAINQPGGYRNGTLTIMDDGDPHVSSNGKGYLFAPGSTYLFATRYSKKNNIYGVSSSYTWKLISTNKTLTTNQLRTLSVGSERVKKLQTVYPNEILSPFDVEAHNTANSFQSLPPIEQERIKAEAERIKIGIQ